MFMLSNGRLKLIAITFFSAILLTASFSYYLLFAGKEPIDDMTDIQDNLDNPESALVVVSSPESGEVVSSPIEVLGRARGVWYFEADFPISLYDGSGNLLASVPATAQSDWMTDEFVPFKASINYSLGSESDGWLVFKKSNPSGLPEHDAEISIPVRLLSNSSSARVRVFFSNWQEDSDTDCSRVYAVDREIPDTVAPGRSSLLELIKGVGGEEYDQGYRTGINPATRIQGLSIDEGVARVDFSSELEEGVAGSCLVTAIRAQITETLRQFSTVDEVVISVDGRTEDILQP